MTYDIATFSAPRTIFGTSENDTLNGHGGHDTLNGGIGDDIITGGAGSDTAVSWQPSKSFLIKAVANDPRITVEDKVGADGTDHLFDVEYLRFSDQTLPLSWITNTANLGVDDILSIVDLYTAGLDRAPDAVGLAYWSSQLADGRNLADISKSFFATLEPTAMYGASLSTKHFVEKAYANALGRVPDAAGGAYWINEIETGNVGRSDFFAALIAGARSPTGSTTDAQYLANKEAAGVYFGIIQGLTNVDWARAVDSIVTGSVDSVAAAREQTDAFAVTAALPDSSELVVQLVGVVH